MATATLESFKAELERLVDKFGHGERTFKHKDYLEDRVRTDFLDPFIRALGWDRDNTKNQIESVRDVESESSVRISGNKKRADYLFRTNGNSHFICEAKKPIEELDPHAWQAKRYAWNLGLAIATLSDFEDFHIYVVGSRPEENESAVGQYKIWNYKKYVECAEELWNLFSYENVKSGSLERLVESLPKKASGKNKGGYAIKPDRTKTVDKVFLEDLEKSRLELGKNIFKNNGRKDVFEHNQLNESTQRILDRILFLRICEARGIDTGQTLESLSDKSRHPKDGTSAYAELAKYFQKLGKPTSGVPYFNGNIFLKHPSEDLIIDNHVLLEFIDNLSAEKSPYLFQVMPIEILGSIYEQFLGKQLVAKGSGVAVDEKPAVKKAGGVYYTPRYIVDYIVEQTLGKQLSEIASGNGQRPSLKDFEKQTSALKVLDPSCGSGSFLIRAFERICEHWERRLKDDLPLKDAPNRAAWEKDHRTHCYIDPQRDAVFLTVGLKKKILLDNIYGVDIDSAAVEVTQLSLYLKMLEHETKTTLGKQKDLFPSDIAVLPALKDNIKWGNSLISSDFSKVAEDLTRVHAFDWSVQFEAIMKDGGFDTVIGNPPYVQIENISGEDRDYYKATYGEDGKLGKRYDLYQVFVMQGLGILRKGGAFGNILPNTFLMGHSYELLRKRLAVGSTVTELVDLPQGVFSGVVIDNVLLFFIRAENLFQSHRIQINKLNPKSDKMRVAQKDWDVSFQITQGELSPKNKYKINIHTGPEQAKLFSKVERSGRCLGDVTESSQGIILYKTEAQANEAKYTGFQERKGWKRLLRGKNIARYETRWGGEFVSYGDWLWCQRDEKFFIQNKILLHAMRNKSLERRLVGTIDNEVHYNAHNLANIILTEGSDYSIRFVLGIFNSALINFWYRSHFPNVNINPSDFRQIPFPKIDFSSPAEKSRHDELVQFVDNMLDLTPKMRTAKSETDKATLQNAITATDNKIDRLVYDLYGLTEDEIKLVEESSVNNK